MPGTLTTALSALETLSTRELGDLLDALEDRLGCDVAHRRSGKRPLDTLELEANAPLLVVLEMTDDLNETDLTTLIQTARVLRQALQPVEQRKKRIDKETREAQPVARGTVQIKRIRRQVVNPDTGEREWRPYGPYLYIRSFASGGGRRKDETRLNNTYLGCQPLAEIFEELPQRSPERKELTLDILEGYKNGTLDEVYARWAARRANLPVKEPSTASPGEDLPLQIAPPIQEQPAPPERVRPVPPTPVYQFKITLLGIDPPIWRRFQVRSDLTFHDLHNVIQVVMGWENYHLYQFHVGYRKFNQQQMGHDEYSSDQQVARHIGEPGDLLYYEYDFGDDWMHELVLEKVLSRGGRKQYPICLAGRRACPPEDNGGPYLYIESLRILRHRKGARYRELRETWPRKFNPEAFDVEAVNQDLAELIKDSDATAHPEL